MIHRHLDYDPSTPAANRGRAAIDDLLDRGDLDDWAPVAQAVAADPAGALATAVLELCEAHPMYGTSALWSDWIRRLRRGGRRGGAQKSTGVSLAELRQQRGLRQIDVAAGMGVSQPDVSKIEARRDLRVSTLSAYVAATGNRLLAYAAYGGEHVELSLPADDREHKLHRSGDGGSRRDSSPRSTDAEG